MSKPAEVNKALKILHLNRNATFLEVIKTFKKLALKYHPDRCEENKKPKCKEKFIKINNAKKVLEDYYAGIYKASFEKETKKKVRRYRKHIKEYREYIKKFYEDWFGGTDL